MVLLLYCIQVPPAADARSAARPLGSRAARRSADYVEREAAGGGPRSAIAATVQRELRRAAARRMHQAALAGRACGRVRGRRA